MELQLRPSAPRFHPLMRPMYRRAGFAGLGLTPGYTPAQQAMADAFASQGGSAPAAVYQAPAVIPPPACSQDTQPGGAAFSAACIAQLLATEQQNMQLANNANFAVDYQNCVAQGISPAECGAHTYGLTPAGGFTSDSGYNRPTIMVDANNNPVASPYPVYTGGPLPGSPASGSGASINFTNLSSGNPSKLTVGDRWQIQISNAAKNAPVSVMGGQNGANSTTAMGTTDSAGNWTSNGQVSADMIGSWQEAWSVGGRPVGNISFSVVPAGTTSTSKTPATGGSITGSFVDLLSKTTLIGGSAIPDWALVGAALVAGYFLFMRGK
jgi:hypothetical protein